MTSYTVITGVHKAIQFCAPEAALDMKVMALAKSMYKNFASGCEKRDSLGHLIVCEMDVVAGVAFSIAQREICAINKYSLLERTVQDLAKFFASSWTSGIDMTPWIDTAVTSAELSRRLETLAEALPERFRSKLIEVRDQLPLLFAPDYPQVLNHADPWEMNIHVSPSTRAITGMVDWRDAAVGPFGLSFWGLETLLGTFGADGWHFHARHLDLRRTFWETLYATAGIAMESQKQAVRVGRIVGIFQAYGLSKGVPVETGNLSLSALEEVLSVTES
ncbi:unnamed protein product [Penicillium salamii]|uniref:Aminoglycoside phosphotransferase domain-containing protein n=1 Tax=Penicillium salamii TaxID=1612424 RepID=A0A9W4JYY3_9EURO|nr:unnamed protein product [Penicillium salamii]CAG8360767.1 unnamed protein product [Penicillium salamii]CAG8420957.1 unnamed protein product [Penicillium salamii]CAG8424316.1 unnamed protein product [Penicillium salamii]